METLAYLHVAQNYEDLTSKDWVFWQNRRSFWRFLKTLKFDNQVAFWLVGVTCSTLLLAFAQSAQALVQFGDRGSDVLQLQTLLRRAGFFNQEPTAYYGAVTEDAVRRFQASARLTVDGIAGDRTLAALTARLASPSPSTPPSSTVPTSPPFPTTPGALPTGLLSTGSLPTGSIPAGTPPLAPTSGAINRILRLGDTGNDVARLQDLLRSAGFFTGTSTGFFGPLTENAVANLQQAKGLTVDRVVGPLTLAVLQPSAGRPGRPVGGNTTPRPAPTPTQPPTTTQTLRPGDRCTEVATLQQRLTDLGYYTGPISGTYGPLTEEAVRTLQSRLNLEVDGIFGPATAGAIS